MTTTPDRQRTRVEGPVGQGMGDRRRARVLVVDDDPSIRTMLMNSLGGPYHVDEAEDGCEALTKLSASAYDVVISDVDMPRLDGLKLAETIRELFPGTSVVLMSGTHFYGDAARESGAKFFLQKPFTIELLREMLASQMRLG